MAKVGRPSEYSPEMCGIVETTIASGATMTQIANAIGVDTRTAYRYMEQHDEFRQAVLRARAQADAIVEGSLFSIAAGHDPDARAGERTKAAQVWLTNRSAGEWSDTKRVELSGRDGDAIEQRVDLKGLTVEELATLESILDKAGAEGTDA